MNKILITLLVVILIVVAFVFGGGVGIYYQTQQDAPKLKQVEVLQEKMKVLSSRVVHTILGYGVVSDINESDKTITLSTGGSSLKINALEEATFFSIKNNESGDTARKPAVFGDVKKGDMISAYLKFSPDGEVGAYSLLITTTKYEQEMMRAQAGAK